MSQRTYGATATSQREPGLIWCGEGIIRPGQSF